MTTHGTATPAKTKTAYCADCGQEHECYDFGRDGLYCCKCLRAVGNTNSIRKSVRTDGIKNIIEQGELF